MNTSCELCGKDVADAGFMWGGKVFCSECCKIIYKEKALEN